MCDQCGSEHIEIFKSGIHTGLDHLSMIDNYYQGLNQYNIEYDDLEKSISIGATKTKSYGEEPIDKYIQELLDEIRAGLREGDRQAHIKEIFQKFSGRKFQDRSWWGNLTNTEIEELLSGVRAYYLPHTAMLNSGLSEAFLFGKFTKQLTENMSLEEARRKIKGAELSTFDKARVEHIQKTSKIFWDKAIQRESDTVSIKLLKHNRDIATEILEKPTTKGWRSLTSDIYNSINKDSVIVLRDLDRITLTETANAQNHAILVSGQEDGSKYFIVHVRPTACKWCKAMYLDKKGNPKKFLISDIVDQERNVNWGKKAKDFIDQPPPLHPFCHCRIYIT